jgi:uncharacterized protein
MIFSLSQYMPQERVTEFCQRNYVKKLALFGSAIKGELRPDSDIDILVQFEEGHVPGYFRLCEMENELTDIIGRQVDLRTPEELSKYFRNDVVKSAKVQYEIA